MVMERLKRNNNIALFIASILVLLGCSSQSMDDKFYKNYLGINVLPEKQVFFYKEESAQNEEFSFEVIKYSTEGKLEIKKGYPIKDEYKQKWKIAEWQETLINDNVEKDFDIVFKYSIENKDVKTKLDSLKEIIQKKGNYYCYYYKKSSDYVEAISLYVIDTQENELYIFNIET